MLQNNNAQRSRIIAVPELELLSLGIYSKVK